MTMSCCGPKWTCSDCYAAEIEDLRTELRAVYTTLHASRSGWAQRIARSIKARYKEVTGEEITFHATP
jgi:hypothetical protein